MANVQKLELGKTDYWDNERHLFVVYNRNLIKSTGLVRGYDEDSMLWWNCRIISIKYIKCAKVYKYEIEKL